MRRDLLERFDWLPSTVQNHIRGIEIHEQIVAVDIAHEPEQPFGRLLAGLQMQVLTVLPAMVADLLRDRDHFGVEGI